LAHLVRAHPLPLLEISAGTEHFIASAREHDGADGGIVDQLAAETAERVERIARKRVAPIRPIDGEQTDGAAALEFDGLARVGHLPDYTETRALRTLKSPPAECDDPCGTRPGAPAPSEGPPTTALPHEPAHRE